MEVSDEHRIKISFKEFELEEWRCQYDYVTIKDDDGTLLLPKRCGTNMPREPIISNTNKAYLNFRSDEIFGLRGFRLEWEKVPLPCRDELGGSVQFYIIFL